MSQSNSTLHRGGSLKPTNAERELRIDSAAHLILARTPYSQCIRALESKFNVSRRTCETYLAEARKRLEEESRVGRAEARALAVGRVSALGRLAEMKGDLQTALRAEETKAKLEGLNAPIEHDIRVADLTNDDRALVEETLRCLRQVVSTLPKDEIKRYAAMARARRAALGLPERVSQTDLAVAVARSVSNSRRTVEERRQLYTEAKREALNAAPVVIDVEPEDEVEEPVDEVSSGMHREVARIGIAGLIGAGSE